MKRNCVKNAYLNQFLYNMRYDHDKDDAQNNDA